MNRIGSNFFRQIMNRSRRSVGVKADQPSLEECFLAKVSEKTSLYSIEPSFDWFVIHTG